MTPWNRLGKSQAVQELLSPIVKEFQDIKARGLVSNFNKYQTAYIKAVKDGGAFPKPQEYGLPESVSFEKIIELQKKLKEIK